jgi:chemotaxis protein methyltransferase CheR
VDEAALEKAGRGVYHQNSFRAMNPTLLERHFVRQGASAQVKEGVRKLVTFRQGNLLEPSSFLGLGPMDVIFCRNVLIYFSDAATLRAVRQFAELLRPGGYLFLGHAESLSRVTDMFTPIRFQGAMVYQKPERS